MELTPVERLQLYHSSPKIKCGIAYITAPPESAPEPEVKNPVTVGLEQAASAFFELSKIYKNIGTEL